MPSANALWGYLSDNSVNGILVFASEHKLTWSTTFVVLGCCNADIDEPLVRRYDSSLESIVQRMFLIVDMLVQI